MRGPYEPSAEKFVDCVCQTLKVPESYTINEAKRICGVSYVTIRNYFTVDLHDINLRTANKCKRLIKPEEVHRSYSGFKVTEVIGGSEVAKRDPCKTELESNEDDEKRKTESFRLSFYRHGHIRFSRRNPEVV